MQQYFVSMDLELGERIFLDEEASYHQIRVLRAREGDLLRLVDQRERAFLGSILPFSKKDKLLQVEILESLVENREFGREVVLFLALIKKDKFEWALQKATELGVTRIVPLVTEYTNHSFSRDLDRFRGRWEKIIREASEQSERHKIPMLDELLTFDELSDHLLDLNIFCYERSGEKGENLIELMQEKCDVESVGLVIGPEGGFSDREVAEALEIGFHMVSLGSRVLRAETAVITALSPFALLW